VVVVGVFPPLAFQVVSHVFGKVFSKQTYSKQELVKKDLKSDLKVLEK